MTDKVEVQPAVVKVLRPSNHPSFVGPETHYTGTVTLTRLVQGEEPSCLTCALVAFQAGARTAWHTHPKGQLLVVTEGLGLIQEWGNPIKRIQRGDVIWTPPNVKHWHGASFDSSMAHMAIQESLNGKVIDWMEKVNEDEYRLVLTP
jgi:quercetin dioxygenase-like cupin family protein